VTHPDRRALLVEVADRLAAAGVPDPASDARWLVDHVVEVAGDTVGRGASLLDELIGRRVAREPVQLIVGRTWFRHLELVCAPGVFIPRPETEVVASLAIDAARAVSRTTAPVRVVEPCCGTGAIALTLAAEVPGVQVVAGDVSAAAVALTRTNLGRVLDGAAGGPLAPGSSVRVVTSDLLDGVDPAWRGHLDVLVANPPYLPSGDRDSWAPEVADHDPDRALVGGDDGHEVVDALLAAAGDWLRPGGTVVLEIDERRADDALATARSAGLSEVRIVPDLTGADRAIVARR
jgi:release factor glutamine methyltransferase